MVVTYTGAGSIVRGIQTFACVWLIGEAGNEAFMSAGVGGRDSMRLIEVVLHGQRERTRVCVRRAVDG